MATAVSVQASILLEPCDYEDEDDDDDDDDGIMVDLFV